MKFNFKKIFVQRSIYDDFIWRANAENIIGRFPGAEVVEVESHWKIPELYRSRRGRLDAEQTREFSAWN
jgi:hypothetical protein